MWPRLVYGIRLALILITYIGRTCLKNEKEEEEEEKIEKRSNKGKK